MELVDYDEVFKLARWVDDGRVPAVSPLVLALLIYLNSVKNHLPFSH